MEEIADDKSGHQRAGDRAEAHAPELEPADSIARADCQNDRNFGVLGENGVNQFMTQLQEWWRYRLLSIASANTLAPYPSSVGNAPRYP